MTDKRLMLINDCIKMNMEIIANSTKALQKCGNNAEMTTYFRKSIERSKEAIKFNQNLKIEWKL